MATHHTLEVAVSKIRQLFPLSTKQVGDVVRTTVPLAPVPYEGSARESVSCSKCERAIATGTYRVNGRMRHLCGLCGVTAKSSRTMGTFFVGEAPTRPTPKRDRTDYVAKGATG